MKTRENWLDQLLVRIQEFRYGNPGIAIASGLATFTILWTVLNAAGVPGSPIIFLIILYISTLASFATFTYFGQRQHQRELLAFRYAHTLGVTKLAAEHSRTIGVVAPLSFWSTDYYIEIIKAIRDAADREVRAILKEGGGSRCAS